MKISLKKKIAAAAAAVTIVGGSGIALAYWTSTGNGSGSAATGQETAWQVDADEAVALDGPLTPGGPASTIPFHVTNNSTGHQGLNQVVVSVGDTDPDTGDLVAWSDGDCDADDFSIGGTDAGAAHVISYLPAVDLAADGVHDDEVTIEMINKASAQDDCKNVVVPLYLAAS